MLSLLNRRSVLALAVLALAAAATAVRAEPETVRFDVVEDHTRFHFEQNGPLHDDGMPAYGNGFVTRGYLYPAGTLDDTEGVTKDGSPTYPDQVIGEWTCYGRFIGDGAHTDAGAWVVSTQLYDFGEGHGQDVIVSHGYELSAPNETVRRAVTGGTGQYAAASGVVKQTLLGFTEVGMGVRLRMALELSSR